MNATHIYNGKYMDGYSVIRYQFGGRELNNNTGDLCVMMWLKSPHPHMMPWFTVPCNESHPVDYIVCESKDSTQSSMVIPPSIIAENSKVVVWTKPGCTVHQTLITDHCFQIHAIESLHLYDECLPIFQSGLDTQFSPIELEKDNLFLFLEDWAAKQYQKPPF